MEQKGLSLIEVVFIIFLLVLAVLFLPVFLEGFGSGNRHKALLVKCKTNLDQIGKVLALYRMDYGRDYRYPDAEGAYFLGRLYKVRLLRENKVYICPCTPDENEGIDLGKDSGIEPQWISYAGRKNKNQLTYPGLYQVALCTTLTTTASDDWEESPNHENGAHINFLFQDGHTDYLRDPSLDNDDYDAFAIRNGGLAHPLTN